MDSRLANEVSVADLFDQFIEATTMKNVLSIHHRIMNYSDLSPCEFNQFYPKLKSAVMTNRTRKNWKAKALFSKIDKKAAHRCYSNTKVTTPLGNRSKNTTNSLPNECLDSSVSSTRHHYNNDALQHFNCLVIGSGPAGLRTAIELQLLGASKVVVVEKRSRFSRNNVLHLWPFVIHDLKSLGAKKFYGKFCAGSIDHISIRQIQLILLKISLIIGCDFRDSCSYLSLCPATVKLSNSTQPENSENGDKCTTGSQATKCDLDLTEVSNSIEYTKVSDNTDSKTDNNHDVIPTSTLEADDITTRENIESMNSEVSSTQNETTASSQENTAEQISAETKSETYHGQRRSGNLRGVRAHFQSEYKLQEKELHDYEWDIIIGADGRRNTLSKYFPRKEFRGRLAIAITANFINRQTPIESAVPEISGLSFIYNQDMFQALASDENIDLENICYYKDDTHYFVMTAKKKSLLERGVLIKDYPVTQDLLSEKNVNRQALLDYARDAAYWTTGLNPLDFALNHYGQEDCALFDFTSMYAAANACKALRTVGDGLTLVSLVGDSLLEPFWPTGSGCARGFLSSFDAAWMCRQWAVHRCPVIEFQDPTPRSGKGRSSTGDSSYPKPTTHDRMALSVMAERESIYRLLAQTTSENLQQAYSHWTLNPHSRYPNLNRHLVVPSQIEHLITGTDLRTSPVYRSKTLGPNDRNRRVKSPNNARKSPKKLKSANASPQTMRRMADNRNRSLSKFNYKSKSRNDIDTYLEFERSYDNLTDSAQDIPRYLNYKSEINYDDDETSTPSISGISPSASNLLSLEAKRSRDIDECLRLRRQRNQLSVVRDHLKQQFKADPNIVGQVRDNPVILSELRRYREQKLARGKENLGKDETRPLTLLNSIRRCASFAERVKSFENRTSSIEPTSPLTPRAPLDTVKNLPEFSTLKQLFQSNGRDTESTKKAKIPIMKLSKEDWNVKCWEKRLAAHKQRTLIGGSTRSLNKAVSVDSYVQSNTSRQSERQVEVFKDRIREMADKLNSTSEKSKVEQVKSQFKKLEDTRSRSTTREVRNQGWVSHLRSELIKSSDSSQVGQSRKALNPFAPRQPIKKLFQDENGDDSEVDMDKHYDHLCINRPTNKYLQRNVYTSHLARTKINTATARVINREPVTASKAAHLTALKSKQPNYSQRSDKISMGTELRRNQDNSTKCFRCKQVVDPVVKISIGGTSLHRSCLMCASCGITLRTNEIQHHLNSMSEDENDMEFVCSICKPSIRQDMNREAVGRSEVEQTPETSTTHRLRSREEFLNQQIDYNVLYKNIIEGSGLSRSQTSSAITRKESSASRDYEDTKDNEGPDQSIMSPSPIKFTLPIEILSANPNSAAPGIEAGEDADGAYQVTLRLPSSLSPVDDEDAREMMDEEELNRILHLDTSTSKRDDESSPSEDEEEEDDEDEDDKEDSGSDEELQSRSSSSLSSPTDSDEYDDADSDDQNSIPDNFSTCEEFAATSEDRDESVSRLSVDMHESEQRA